MLIEQSWMSGIVKSIPYRGILYAQLDVDEFVIGLVLIQIVLVRIYIHQIREVQLLKNIFVPEIVINYLDHRGGFKNISLRTVKYLQWGQAFKSLGVLVKYPNL